MTAISESGIPSFLTVEIHERKAKQGGKGCWNGLQIDFEIDPKSIQVFYFANQLLVIL